MGGIAKKIESPFRTGASQAKKQQQLMEQQAKQAEAMRQQQENVAKAEASLAEDKMFSGAEEGLGIEGIDTTEVGGKRKRKQQQTGSGLGI